MGSKVIRNITKVFKSASGVLFGRATAGTGRGEELTPSQVRSLLSVYTITQTDTAISTAVNNLVAGAPGILDTLDELSAALGDDANFASTVTTALAGKVDSSSLNESIDDRVAALLVAGTNITLTYNDASGTLTVASTASGGSPGGVSGQVQFNDTGAFGGATALVYAATGTHLVVTAQSATVVPLCLKGAASQSANLFECRNSANALRGRITKDGQLAITFDTAVVGSGITVAGTDGNTYATIGGGGVYGFGSWVGMDVISNIGRVNVGAGQMHLTHASGNRSRILTAGNLELSPGNLGAGGTYVEINSGTAGTLRDLILRNVGLNGAISAGGGVGIAFIANATTVPTTNPTGGGILYCEAGALKFRGSSGTVTTLGPA